MFAAYLPVYYLRKRLILLLSEFATSGTYFLFQGTFHDQTDGVAMGSPLDPVLANFFMGYYETHFINVK